MKSATTRCLKGSKGVEESFTANRIARGISVDATSPSSTIKKSKSVAKINNDWIPTKAVQAIISIKEQFDGRLSETAISRILYELNTIWRNIMREEVEAVKRRLTAQIQDLRRQVVTK